MPITKLIVGGFKSIDQTVEIPLAPITLLFGPNSAGKSSVLQALQEFQRLLEVAPRCSLVESSLAALMKRQQGSNYEHQLPKEDADDDVYPASVPITLGCEAERLFDQGCTSSINDSDIGEAGQSLLGLLIGEVVEYVFSWQQYGEVTGTWHFKTANVPVFIYTAPSNLGNNLPLHQDSLPPLSSKLSLPEDKTGWLKLNLKSPVWDCQGSKTYIEPLLACIAGLGDTWASTGIWTDGDWLHIRVPLLGRKFVPWVSNTVLPSRGLFIYDLSDDEKALLLSIDAVLNPVISLLNEFLHQVEWALAKKLGLLVVPGDRRVLSAGDVSTTGGKVLEEKWRPLNILTAQDSIAQYAKWLGGTSVNHVKPHSLDLGTWQSRDDFVNDTLRSNLFPKKDYQVKAEVTRLTEEVLLSKGTETEGNEYESFEYSLYLQDGQGRTFDFSDVGSGISYVMPVLTALWAANRSWIEQPELHLHPAAQCEMGDAFIRAYNRGRLSVIETHSEHVLLRILRRIRQTTRGQAIDPELRCQPEAVAVLYFEPQENGGTKIHRLRVTRGGDFMDQWPAGFFEERALELFDE